MKAGDLVTLSAYGLRMGPMWKYKRHADKGDKITVGVIVEVKENPYWQPYGTKNEKMKYVVRWCGEGPPNRHNSAHTAWNDYFLRNDLRFVK